ILSAKVLSILFASIRVREKTLRLNIFFFFKQKTAYEMIWRLEFRRVLFRSRLPKSKLKQNWLALLNRKDVSSRTGAILFQILVRSEERRVGKECRWRGSTG